MNKELTAVEWLWEQIDNSIPYQNIKTSQVFNDLLKQAKALHRQQIIDAVYVGFEEGCNYPECIIENAEQYYNDKYGQ